MTKAKSYGKGKSLIQSPFCWSTSRSASLEKVSVNSGKNNGKPRKPKRLVRESYTAGTRKNWRNSKPPSKILMLLRKKNGGPGSFWNKRKLRPGGRESPTPSSSKTANRKIQHGQCALTDLLPEFRIQFLRNDQVIRPCQQLLYPVFE